MWTRFMCARESRARGDDGPSKKSRDVFPGATRWSTSLTIISPRRPFAHLVPPTVFRRIPRPGQRTSVAHQPSAPRPPRNTPARRASGALISTATCYARALSQASAPPYSAAFRAHTATQAGAHALPITPLHRAHRGIRPRRVAGGAEGWWATRVRPPGSRYAPEMRRNMEAHSPGSMRGRSTSPSR